MKKERVLSTPNSWSATNCGTRIFSDNAVLGAKTASTPDLFGDQISTTPRYLVCNPFFPGTKSLISTPQLLPRLLKESIKPPSAKRGPKDFIRMDPPIFTRGLPGGSSKTRLAGHAAYRMMLPQHSKLHSTSFQNFRFSHINVAYLTQKFYIYRFARKVLFSFLHKVL